nr:LamG domain-containing protein [Saprospiraceae bacterium]
MLHARSVVVFLLLLSICLPPALQAQSQQIADWTFHPNYTLPRNAANYPGNRIDPPQGRFERFKRLGGPVIYQGQQPTQRLSDLLAANQLPSSGFTLEVYVLNHVNQPVGALLSAGGVQGSTAPNWYLGYYDKELSFYLRTAQNEELLLSTPLERGWKNYWSHITAVYTGQEIQLYVNGELKGEQVSQGNQVQYNSDGALELFGYFANEPFMELPNLIKQINLYSTIWKEEEVQEGFVQMQNHVQQGLLFEDLFHFTAGPYLNFARQNQINIVWETDRPAKAIVRYGTQVPLDQEIVIDSLKY